MRDNKHGTCLSIDGAISADRNVIKKEDEKILKYKNLTIPFQRMWNVKAKMIPVITGETWTISKSPKQYLSNIRRKDEIEELRKSAILDNAHQLGEVLM